MRPSHERLALEVEVKFKALEAICREENTKATYERLEQYALSIAKEPTVMNYLKLSNKGLSTKIEGLVKSHELKQHQLEREMGEREL